MGVDCVAVLDLTSAIAVVLTAHPRGIRERNVNADARSASVAESVVVRIVNDVVLRIEHVRKSEMNGVDVTERTERRGNARSAADALVLDPAEAGPGRPVARVHQ